MAKQSRGSNRVPNRPATPATPATPASSTPSNRPSGQRPAGQRPAGQKSRDTWQPSRVSASKSSSSGPNRTTLMTVGAIIVGVLIVAYVAFTQLGGNSDTVNNDAIITPGAANSTPASIHTDGRTLGDPNAPVTIDLYGDFRCSACYTFTESGTAMQVNTQLVATGKAKVVWHDFTIIDGTSQHASRDAANAAWCAADQNKFWVMHDWLYANQTSEAASVFTMDRLLKIGQQMGLEMTAYTSCLQGGTHNADIAAEQKTLPASVAGHGTPSVLVKGAFVNATFAEIKTAVDTASGSGSPAPASGSPAPSGS
jgi:protein-disulfide isomerase